MYDHLKRLLTAFLILVLIASLGHPIAVADESPDMSITSVDIPGSVSQGEAIYITVKARNWGGTAKRGGITVSFPDDPPAVEIVGHDAPQAKVYQRGEMIYSVVEGKTVPAKYTLAETYYDESYTWPGGVEHFIKIRVVPASSARSLTVYIRVTVKGYLDEDAWDPEYSNVYDQQGYPVYVEEVSIILPVTPTPTPTYTLTPPPDPPDMRITSIEIPDSVQEGEEIYVTVRAKNEGGTAKQGSISVSFPDNPPVVEIVSHDAPQAKVYQRGEMIYSVAKGKTVPALYPLAETWYDESYTWPHGVEHFMTIKVVPASAAHFLRVYVRVVVKGYIDEDAWDPEDGESDIYDQQGYPVFTPEVSIILPDISTPTPTSTLMPTYTPTPAPTLTPTYTPTPFPSSTPEPKPGISPTTTSTPTLFPTSEIPGSSLAMAFIVILISLGVLGLLIVLVTSLGKRRKVALPPVPPRPISHGAKLPTTADLQSLGPYKIVRLIGQGGMAKVYKAWQPSLNRPVALKVLLPQLTSDPSLIKRFQQEATTAARLRHPNIVTIYDVGEEGGIYFIAMEYLEGKTLKQIIDEL